MGRVAGLSGGHRDQTLAASADLLEAVKTGIIPPPAGSLGRTPFCSGEPQRLAALSGFAASSSPADSFFVPVVRVSAGLLRVVQ